MVKKEESNEKLEVNTCGYLREKKARLETEKSLEDTTRQLYLANEALREKYNELEQYIEEQKFSLALIKMAQKTNNFDDALQFFLNKICKLKGWPIGHVYLLKEDNEHKPSPSEIWFFSEPKKYKPLYKKMAFANLKKTYHLSEPLSTIKKAIFIQNLGNEFLFLYKNICQKLGIQSILLVPLRSDNRTIGFLEFFFTTPEQFDKKAEVSLQAFVRNLENVLERQKARDIAKETSKKLRQALLDFKHVAYHDYLTGLPNRRLFEIILKKDIASARRHKQFLALLYIDVDNFKKINDQFGHNIGDEFLKHLAKRFLSIIRTEDLAARIGGDEFAIVAQIDKLQDAEIICKKLIQKIRKPYKINSQFIAASISIGIAVYPKSGATYATLYKRADAALYKAKEAGKGTYWR